MPLCASDPSFQQQSIKHPSNPTLISVAQCGMDVVLLNCQTKCKTSESGSQNNNEIWLKRNSTHWESTQGQSVEKKNTRQFSYSKSWIALHHWQYSRFSQIEPHPIYSKRYEATCKLHLPIPHTNYLKRKSTVMRLPHELLPSRYPFFCFTWAVQKEN